MKCLQSFLQYIKASYHIQLNMKSIKDLELLLNKIGVTIYTCLYISLTIDICSICFGEEKVGEELRYLSLSKAAL